jgi:hypothetical protein
MGTITLPETLTNGQPNDADDVMANFAAILAQVNGNIDLTNLASSLSNGLLKLLTAGDHKLAYGKINNPPAFGGGRKVDWTIAHGLGAVPVWAHVSDSYVPAADSSTGNDEPATASISAVSSANISVKSFLPIGATASIGPGATWWAAIS